MKLASMKAALTRAKKTGDPQKVIDEVEKAFTQFEEDYWPDNWSLWQRAKDDAELSLRFSTAPRW